MKLSGEHKAMIKSLLLVISSLFVIAAIVLAASIATSAEVVSVQSGNWSDPSTWDQQPNTGDEVTIRADHTVTVASKHNTLYQTINVQGKLTFAPDTDTSLRFDTMWVYGACHVGTVDNPIQTGKTTELLIHPVGDLSGNELSRGVIIYGEWKSCGATKTGYATTTGPAREGETRINLIVPNDWRIGDTVVIAGTNPTGLADEKSRIIERGDNYIRLQDGLVRDHVLPGNRPVHVINMTRNVQIKSTHYGSFLKHCGHWIMMGTPRGDVRYTGFYNLGRTDKKEKPSETNPLGRYPCHFHRCDPAAATPIQCIGNAVENSPGNGFVHHSSNVHIKDCVGYNCDGSIFFGESGDEQGLWKNNVGIRAVGSGESTYDRADDFGHQGHAFWLQGPGIVMENNVATDCGNTGSGFGILTEGLNDISDRYPVSFTPYPSDYGSRKVVSCGDVPFRATNNIAYGCKIGWLGPNLARRSKLNTKHVKKHGLSRLSVITGTRIYNCEWGAKMQYTHHLKLVDWNIISDVQPAEYGIWWNGSSGESTGEKITIHGYEESAHLKIKKSNYAIVTAPLTNADLVFRGKRKKPFPHE